MSTEPIQPRVAACVLNYNGLEITLETLESLQKLEYPSYELVVIDNGSTDGSHQAIAERFPDLRQLRVHTNRGISWGLNHGIQDSLERGFDYVLLMNNDIEVDPRMLDEMVTAAEADPAIGCVGPKCYYYDEPERIWSAGGRLRWRESVTRERGDGEVDRGQYDVDGPVDYINGCAMLIRRRALEETGYWDPVYYLGVEDADFCTRLKQRGFLCHYAHDARLWHRISHSIGVYKPTRTFHTGRSSAIYLRKYASPTQWIRSLLFLALAIPAAFVRELPRRNHSAAISKLRGFVAGMKVALPPIPQSYDELDRSLP